MSIETLLTQLTKKHLDPSTNTIHVSLIEQLREAVLGIKSGAQIGGSGGYAGKAPLNVSALSLAREIEEFAFKYGHGATIEECLEAIVQEALAVGRTEDIETDLTQYSARIRALVEDDVKRLNIECPACSVKYLKSEDGARSYAVTVKAAWLSCRACGFSEDLLARVS